jgi:hypothetical protein
LVAVAGLAAVCAETLAAAEMAMLAIKTANGADDFTIGALEHAALHGTDQA